MLQLHDAEHALGVVASDHMSSLIDSHEVLLEYWPLLGANDRLDR